MPSLQLGALVHDSDLAAILSKLHQQILADVGVRHLAAAEADRHLAAVALDKNFWAFLSFTLKSFTSMLGDIRTSLISTTR